VRVISSRQTACRLRSFRLDLPQEVRGKPLLDDPVDEFFDVLGVGGPEYAVAGLQYLSGALVDANWPVVVTNERDEGVRSLIPMGCINNQPMVPPATASGV
jgi:hypothetical protein